VSTIEPIRAFVDRYLAHVAEWSASLQPPDLDEDAARQRVRSGSSWIDPAQVGAEANMAAEVLDTILGDLSRSCAHETPALAWLQELSAEGHFSAAALLEAVLRRAPSDVCRIAQSAALPAQALHLLGVFVARPFLTAALRGFDPALVNIETSGASCPGCGFGAALGILLPEEGHRQLWCRYCGSLWPVKRLQCPSCGNHDASRLGYFTVDGFTGRRVDICEECRCYIKTRDLRDKETQDVTFLPEVEDLNSAELDAAAVREGFLPMTAKGPSGPVKTSGSLDFEARRC